MDRPSPENGTSQARLPWQADDIDGVTQIDESLPPGTIAEVAVHFDDHGRPAAQLDTVSIDMSPQ